MPSLKDFTDAMSATWPVALATFIGSSAILLGEAVDIRYLQTLPDWFLGTAFLVAVFSGSIVVVAIVRGLFELARRPFQYRRIQQAKVKHIDRLMGLPDEEKHILAWAVTNGTQVFLAPFNHERLEPLLAKGYVQTVGGTHSIIAWPYSIPDHIWDYLYVHRPAAGLRPTISNPFERYF